MTLFSTKDDFLQRTLANVPGQLGKLEYVSGLRQGERYAHWGLARVYGEDAAQRALASLHRDLFVEVLRTPLRRLAQDLVQSTAAGGGEAKAYLKCLMQHRAALIPGDLGGGSEAHFQAVMAALSSILR